MAYPIYRQTWDGSPSSYADWNLAGSTGFSVGPTSITSSPNALQLAANINNSVLSKVANEASADGTLSVYTQTPNMAAIVGIMVRCQGQSTTFGDYPAYTLKFSNGYGVFTSYWDFLGTSGTYHIDDVNWESSAFNYSQTSRVLMEIRIQGSTITCSIYNMDGGSDHVPLWLTSGGSISSTPVYAFSITDSTISSVGRIAILNGNGPNAMIVDDVVWDPPTPVIDIPTLSLLQGDTAQLTAGGFFNPVVGVNWTSNTPSIASVNSSGLVTGMNQGTAIITATGITNISQTAVSNVTVTTPIQQSYMLSPISTMTTSFI